jgi:predicted kinase
MREPFLNYVENDLGDGFVLIACGLPGTWKTETTAEVARIKDYPLLRSDIIR